MGSKMYRNMITGLVAFISVISISAGLAAAQTSGDFFLDYYCNVCNIIGYVVVILCAIWVYSDAKDKVGPNGKISKASPLVWAICVFLLWIICFPWYVIIRNDRRKYS